MMNTLENYIAACLEQAQNRHRLAKTSYKMYRWHLRSYAAWKASQPCEPMLPTTADLIEYFDLLQRDAAQGGKGYRPRTMQALRNALNFLDDWLYKSGIAPARVMPQDYPWPKLDAAEKPCMNLQEAAAGAKAAVELKIADPVRAALARAVFFVFATTAIRHSELLQLDVRDFSKEDPSITIRHGKGDKFRKLYISDECRDAISGWLEMRPHDTQHKALFCWDRVRRMAERGVYALLDEISEAAGIAAERKLRPHAMRRGCATRLLEDPDVNIDQIRKILGHSSTKTTEIYINTDAESQKKIRNAGAILPRSKPIALEAPSAQPLPPKHNRLKQDLTLRRRHEAPIRRRLPPDRQE